MSGQSTSIQLEEGQFCDGAVAAAPLDRYARLGLAHDRMIHALTADHERAVEIARHEVRVTGGIVEFHMLLPGVNDVEEALLHAASLRHPALSFQSGPELSKVQPPLRMQFSAASHAGSISLANAADHISSLSLLAQQVSLSLDCLVASSVVGTGSVSDASDLTGVGDRVLAVALGLPLEIASIGPGGGDVSQILEPGSGCLVRRLRSVGAPPGGAWILCTLEMFDLPFMMTVAALKAGWWPLLRVDLPLDMDEPVALYGHDGSMNVAEAVVGQLEQLLDEPTKLEAEAQWQAQLRSATTPYSTFRLLGTPVERWPDHVVAAGTLLGSPTQPIGLATDGDRLCFAAGGWSIAIDRHLQDLLVALAPGQRTEIDNLTSACPSGDRWCIQRNISRLADLGLLNLSVASGQ